MGELTVRTVAAAAVTPSSTPVTAGFGVDDWLSAYRSPATREAYARDAGQWLGWCAGAGIDPATARRPHADAWRARLEQAGLADRSIARKIAAVSSLYGYLVDADLVERNPFARVRRPK